MILNKLSYYGSESSSLSEMILVFRYPYIIGKFVENTSPLFPLPCSIPIWISSACRPLRPWPLIPPPSTISFHLTKDSIFATENSRQTGMWTPSLSAPSPSLFHRIIFSDPLRLAALLPLHPSPVDWGIIIECIRTHHKLPIAAHISWCNRLTSWAL